MYSQVFIPATGKGRLKLIAIELYILYNNLKRSLFMLLKQVVLYILLALLHI